MRVTPQFMTLAKIQSIWPGGRLENDMIKKATIAITGHGGFIVSPVFHLAKNHPIGLGYRTTGNIGFIIQCMGHLLGLFEDDTRDFGRAIENCPVRIYSWAGEKYLETLCIGHFMEDRFVFGGDLIRAEMERKS